MHAGIEEIERGDERPGTAASPTSFDDGPSHRHLVSPAALLRELGLRPRRGFSQSFLTDQGLTRQIAAAGGVHAGDRVLEIGPGLGILTRTLAARAGRVVAFELDAGLAAALPDLVPENVSVVQGDALTLDPAAYFDGPYKLIANLPYQVASPLMLRYLGLTCPPSVLVVMVQREVAERIAVRSGPLSFLAVAVQSAARPSIVKIVPPGAFYPRPKIHSAVLKLEPHPTPLVPPASREGFLRLARAGFTQPRKLLLNSLVQGLGWGRAEVSALLARAQIAADVRPGAIGLEQWRTLYDAYVATGATSSDATSSANDGSQIDECRVGADSGDA